MSRYLSHVEIEGLLAPFALGAVDADERDAVSEHLGACPTCRAEVTEYRRVAAAFGAAEVRAPDEWERLAGGFD